MFALFYSFLLPHREDRLGPCRVTISISSSVPTIFAGRGSSVCRSVPYCGLCDIAKYPCKVLLVCNIIRSVGVTYRGIIVMWLKWNDQYVVIKFSELNLEISVNGFHAMRLMGVRRASQCSRMDQHTW